MGTLLLYLSGEALTMWSSMEEDLRRLMGISGHNEGSGGKDPILLASAMNAIKLGTQNVTFP